ncbi:hypothetical protein GCM10007199_29030 [Fictibacillus barbaricus]|nr:hypothetical protein GCM10007199_29030 [Fictibacillus barbaricus]
MALYTWYTPLIFDSIHYEMNSLIFINNMGHFLVTYSLNKCYLLFVMTGVLLSQFLISKSLKPNRCGGTISDSLESWGESFFKVGLLKGPNPTANSVSVYEKEGGACGAENLRSAGRFS